MVQKITFRLNIGLEYVLLFVIAFRSIWVTLLPKDSRRHARKEQRLLLLVME
uniref:Uncharacterized protein n=1 Tax=Parascaris equorum TaxID=6256 RepID=A0A914RBP1_PAREQ